jgi:sulfur carrier protein
LEITVEIKLFASLRLGRFARDTRSLPPGSRILEVLAMLEIPREEIVMAMKNGKRAGLEEVLQNGDDLSLFPLIGGG